MSRLESDAKMTADDEMTARHKAKQGDLMIAHYASVFNVTARSAEMLRAVDKSLDSTVFTLNWKQREALFSHLFQAHQSRDKVKAAMEVISSHGAEMQKLHQQFAKKALAMCDTHRQENSTPGAAS